MKSEDLIRALGQIDDRFIEEAAPRGKRKSRLIPMLATACAACLLVAFNLWLFIPFSTTPPDMSAYADSEYYSIIQKLNVATFRKPRYKNNFIKLTAGLQNSMENMMGGTSGMDSAPGAAPDKESFDQQYAEVTDNQVTGVIEGDLIKRSDKYIYYFYQNTLRVYAIQGTQSSLVGMYAVTFPDSNIGSFWKQWTIYLSADCRTVTVVAPHYNRDSEQDVITLISLDVSNPAAIKETNRISVTGALLSSRVVNGKLLLLTNFWVKGQPDFSDETTFLPQINNGNGMESIPVESIVCPQEVTAARYTVVCRLDEATLAMEGSAAFLSYSDQVYVSREHVFVTRSFQETKEISASVSTNRTMTEISCLAYGGSTLEHKGSVTVAGYVKDQYSLDEYEDVLRVVTTIDATTIRTDPIDRPADGNTSSDSTVSAETGTSASLYCIDMAQWKVVASVDNFAPRGETVRSVRFDGTTAYVCTAIQVTDPVFFFDLSDINNITYKDTGNIDGFSTSLLNFGDGKLLGIGVGGSGGLKVEIYEEVQHGIASVCTYEQPAYYATEYKAYFIDREKQLIGLGYTSYTGGNEGNRYVLLRFDGYTLQEVLNVTLHCDNDIKRATLIDNNLYLFGGEHFSVNPLP